jgi:two-component system, NtrC family, response regulator PilR
MEIKGKILMVDDNEGLCQTVKTVLTNDGYNVICDTSATEGFQIFKDAFSSDKPFDVIIQDVKMPEISGLELIKHYQSVDPKAIILIFTALSDFQTATEAMRQGAFDFIRKDNMDNERDLKPAIRRAIESRKLRLTLGITDDASYRVRIIGSTPQMKDVYKLVHRIAPTNSTVLIQGESGTGKELIARSIHFQSARAFEPFLTVNCGAFSEHLLESELFGHAKGSFTNAFSDKKGLLEVANKGTFFLDEVSELSPTLQVKLLRAIETREFIPVGATEITKVDVRFIAATNTDLDEQVRKGNFREDLYYRLNVIFVQLPPLRDRKDDIPLLAGYFIDKYNKIMGKNVKEISAQAMEFLMNRYWSGNIRELENVIQRAVALAEETVIRITDISMGGRMTERPYGPADSGSDKGAGLPLSAGLPAGGSSPGSQFEPLNSGFNIESKIEEIEKNYIKVALDQSKWNQTAAAKLLGITLRMLRYKMKKHKL